MDKGIKRRAFIKSSVISVAAATTAAAVARDLSVTAKVIQTDAGARRASKQKEFAHRGYLGWITDLATEPDPHAPWPSIRLDRRLLQDYRTSFECMRQLGFNEISIWGLTVGRAWPLNIEKALSKERAELVETLIEDAHRHGLRVYAGLGVYSWGFEEIIKARPRLSRSRKNRQAQSGDNNPLHGSYFGRSSTTDPAEGLTVKRAAEEGNLRNERT